MFYTFVAALTLATPDADARAVPVKLPSKDRAPTLQDGLSGGGKATPAPARKRMFGLGVGFQSRGTAQGIALDQIVEGSPADRAGLTPGTVIA